MSNEIELKFEINNSNIDALTLFLEQWSISDAAEFSQNTSNTEHINHLKLANTYYDTSDYYLRKHGCGLRIRSSESPQQHYYEMTLKRDAKSIAGLHERAEFNVELISPKLNLFALPNDALPNDCDIVQLQSELQPLFSTDFNRQTWLICFANSEIEVAFDQGQILSKGQIKRIQEVELEIKQGTTVDLLNFAIELCQFKLHLFSQSKAARGYRLLQQSGLKAIPFDQELQYDLTKLLQFWQQNEEYALETDDFLYYKKMLYQVANILMQKSLTLNGDITEWCATLDSIKSVPQFAYSEINTKLKLLLILDNHLCRFDK